MGKKLTIKPPSSRQIGEGWYPFLDAKGQETKRGFSVFMSPSDGYWYWIETKGLDQPFPKNTKPAGPFNTDGKAINNAREVYLEHILIKQPTR